MAISNLVKENEENLREAINDGISGEAVRGTLEDVVNKSDEKKSSPEQLKTTVEVIADMKESSQKVDESFASNLVKNNSEKINSALREGITPNEVANTLVKETNKKGKTHLPFIVKLISKMKKKELKLNMNKEAQKGYQMVKK